MDQTGAMNAICFVDKEDVFAENLRERSQALWAGNRNVLLPRRVMSILRDPDGRQRPAMLEKLPFHVGRIMHYLHQRTQFFPFFIEGIGDNSGWYAIA